MTHSQTTSTDFERLVRSLLQLAGYAVTGERLLGHKKIDAYAEEPTLTSPRRLGVECKNYANPLTLEEVSLIYANYLPLHRDNEIDEILIITANGLTTAANKMVSSTRELRHLTVAELQSRVIDFREYLPQLISACDEQGTESYYVPVRTTSGEDLRNRLLGWISDGPSRPVAILGGYGMGKSTFAQHLATHLARLAVADNRNRIPIVVPLGEIASNQDLGGLLGKLFTQTYAVRNYRLESFMALCRLGRFVVICDGFDEMKHTLSWEEFRYNLREINKLATGNNRLLILGRPTAFLDAQEHQYALHGRREVEGQAIREQEWPDYVEMELAPFDPTQIELFLKRYQIWRAQRQLNQSEFSGTKLSQEAKHHRRAVIATKQSRKVMREIEQASTFSSHLADLTGRPVHLRMLVEVLPQWDGPITNITTTILYQLFIDNLIGREQAKPARLGIYSGEDRRRFARKLAWWMWERNRKSHLRAEEIPKELLLAFGQTRLEGVKRDLVSGSLLDRKSGDVLYFAHRSIQEFLVAEEIVDAVRHGLPLSSVDKALTDEVGIFLGSLLNIGDLARWEDPLRSCNGMLSWNMARLWVAEKTKLDWTIEKIRDSAIPWYGLFATAAVAKGYFLEKGGVVRLANRLVHGIGRGSSPTYDLLIFTCLMILSRQVGAELVVDAFPKIIDRRIRDLERADEQSAKNAKKKEKHPRRISQQTPFAVEAKGSSGPQLTAIDGWLQRLEVRDKARHIRLEGGHSFLRKTLEDYCFLSDWSISHPLHSADMVALENIQVSTACIRQFAEWSRRIGRRIE